jgi:dephospho-CoA kinase
MAVIGITGGIGSGKSTFSQMLAERLPAEIFDADACVRALLDGDAGVRAEILHEVSPLAYLPDGKANRPAIRSLVFSDPGAKTRLEAILHPRVRTCWTDLATTARARGGHLLIDMPLLFETNAQDFLDHVVTVGCSPATQLSRIRARGLSDSDAEKIVLSQLPLEEKMRRSDEVVWNDGSLEILRLQAQECGSRIAQKIAHCAP